MLGDNTLIKNAQSSLPLQVFIYFNWHFAFFFFILNLCLFTYKAVEFYYPSRLLGWELFSLFMYMLIECTRLILASKGNKTSQMAPITGSWLLAIPQLIIHAYYIELQTYVLKVDVVINAIGLFFVGIETLLGVIVFIALFTASRRF